MPIALRAITADELGAFRYAEGTAFGHVDLTQPAVDHDLAVIELDRTIAGFDGDQIVSTAAASSPSR